MHSQLLVGSYIPSGTLQRPLRQALDGQSYRVYYGTSEADFLQWVGQNRHRIDCLLLEASAVSYSLLQSLQRKDILLPAIVLTTPTTLEEAQGKDAPAAIATYYHNALVSLEQTEVPQLERYIHQAIDHFLQLPHNQLPTASELTALEDTRHFLLSLQQQRLTEKLRERLGYLGVYYKRNPHNFLRNLAPPEQRELMDKLRNDYRAITLAYFAKTSDINQRIDTFVNLAFFADVSVSQIVEIHMELMDNFSKQLKLEGRSEEILLDYRLTLIDVIAHLCEMYRRSIPRE